jgi:hypothetical protein
MAYSDYGGYAFKNGERIESRSDAVLSPDEIKSTPGQWPGWTLQEGRDGRSFHALLGDGPIFVGLYKQSSLTIHRLSEKLDELALAKDLPAEAVSSYEHDGKTTRYLNTEHFKDTGAPCVLEADGCRIEVFWEVDDNHYQYVRLTQPDGSVWHGWSGYGVGAGLEDCGYGYSTEDRNKRLCELWPEAIKNPAP